MKILNFGSCNIDYVYSLDHIVAPGETEASHNLETFAGGKGLNQSIAAARAGASVFHAACIGEGGNMLADVMQKSGVDISLLKEVKTKNGHAIIQVSKQGENSIFLYPGSNNMITASYVDTVLEHFCAGDILLLQNEINMIDYILDKASEKGMIVVLNPSPYNTAIRKLNFSKLSYLILNEVEAAEITGEKQPDKILAYFKEHYPDLKIILTLGKKGCMYQDDFHQHTHPVFQVTAVDTTAAGDTFTGYFFAALTEDMPVLHALRLASAASALAVSQQGAEPSIPLRSAVEEALKTLKPVL